MNIEILRQADIPEENLWNQNYFDPNKRLEGIRKGLEKFLENQEEEPKHKSEAAKKKQDGIAAKEEEKEKEIEEVKLKTTDSTIPASYGPIILTPSQIAAFFQCPRRFFLEKILSFPQKRISQNRALVEELEFSAAAIGTFIHRGLELFLKSKTKEEVQNILKQEFPQFFASKKNYYQEIIHIWEGFSRTSYYQSFCKASQKGVEEPFYFRIKKIVIHGQMDLYWKEKGEIFLLDFKHTLLEENSRENADELLGRYRVPMFLYAYALSKVLKVKPEKIHTGLVVTSQVHSPLFYPKWSETRLKKMEHEIYYALMPYLAYLEARKWKEDLFTPNPKECNYCPTPKICSQT